jgi:hypothetical protein
MSQENEQQPAPIEPGHVMTHKQYQKLIEQQRQQK